MISVLCSMDNLAGKEFGKCSLLQYVNKGTFGFVYKARLKSDDTASHLQTEIFAAKLISIKNATDRHRELVNREIDILKQLGHHSNIVAYKYHVIKDQIACLVMDYCEGGTLYQMIQDLKKLKKVMTENEFTDTLKQLSQGIDFLHDNSIIHRDLKTKNMMFTSSKKVIKIGDFGVAKLIDVNAERSIGMGTPFYMSPEILNEQPYDQKTDIWSLGCTCYEMATGSYAFHGDTMDAMKKLVNNGKSPELTAFPYNEDFRTLIVEMLSLESASRPTAKQILEFLREPKTYRRQPKSTASSRTKRASVSSTTSTEYTYDDMDEKAKLRNRKFWEKESEKIQKTLMKNIENHKAPEILVLIKKYFKKGKDAEELKGKVIELIGEEKFQKLFPLMQAMDCLEKGIRALRSPGDLSLSFTGTLDFTL